MNRILNLNSNNPILIDGVIAANPTITIGQEPFLLEKYEFDKVINGKNFINEIRGLLLGTSIALLINMFAKFIGNKINNKIVFDDWEIYAFLTSLVLYIISIIIDECLPSERKRIIKKIKLHFNIK